MTNQPSIPLHEEQLRVVIQPKTSVTSVRTRTESQEEIIDLSLFSTEVSIERIPIDKVVDHIPAVRYEGDITIIPICEEIVVKRVRIVEEIQITQKKQEEHYNESVTLRKEAVEITTSEGNDHDN